MIMTMEPLDDVGSQQQIAELENRLLRGALGCRTTEAVEAAVTYAAFLSSIGMTPESFPVFLRLLEVDNHWVVDALMGERDPFVFLASVQPDGHIVRRLLAMLIRCRSRGVYDKSLLAILGVLQAVYGSPRHGYQVYPLSIQELNALGKHLDKEQAQDDVVNRAIVDILGKLADLHDERDADMEDLAIHAAAIRDAFFDERKHMDDVIPPVLLAKAEGRTEIPPRDRVRPVEKTGKPVAVVMLDETEAPAQERGKAARKRDE
jgi:hypothetical protein